MSKREGVNSRTIIPRRRNTLSTIALNIISIHSGRAVKRVVLGEGSAGHLVISSQAIAVVSLTHFDNCLALKSKSVSHPSPSVHILHPTTLSPLCATITSLPADSRTLLPVVALSGRLLAYATADHPVRPGPDGLGGVITASISARARHSISNGTIGQIAQTRSTSDSSQGALLSSAVEIGGGVARGVWAGLKMGARAANQARNARLARSAPSEASGALADVEVEDDVESESRSLDQSSVLDEPMSSTNHRTGGGGEWIKIVDLQPRSARRGRVPPFDSLNNAPLCAGEKRRQLIEPEVIAHFRSPPGRSVAPLPADPRHRSRQIRLTSQAVTYLSFNADGTQLLVATKDGRAPHIFEIHPVGPTPRAHPAEPLGQVWHLYELRRGNTPGTVCEVTWSNDGRWVGIGTGKGTIRKSETMFYFWPSSWQMLSLSIPLVGQSQLRAMLPSDTSILSICPRFRPLSPPQLVCDGPTSPRLRTPATQLRMQGLAVSHLRIFGRIPYAKARSVKMSPYFARRPLR